jgi:hypothetical protein
MIQTRNLNNLCTDPVAVLVATRAVNLGKILSPLEPRRGQILATRTFQEAFGCAKTWSAVMKQNHVIQVTDGTSQPAI